jgi:hypothetical protein
MSHKERNKKQRDRKRDRRKAEMTSGSTGIGVDDVEIKHF